MHIMMRLRQCYLSIMLSRMLVILLAICLLPDQGTALHYTSAILAEIPAVEVDALLQFKAHLSPPSQVLLRGWDENNTQSVCISGSWVGVTCHASLDHIQALDMSGLGLAGSLAPHLGNLTGLSILNLSNNSFTGHIPPHLSSCSSLKELDLGSNNLTGPIPSSFSSLSSLQSLSLGANHLSGRIPPNLFTNCTSLHVLSLYHNHLTGSIPTHITIPSLLQLLLYENNLTGSIPPSLGNQTQLVKLQLDSNQLSGAIPSELGLLHQLQSLVLSSNALIAGTIPRSLCNCTELYALYVESNHITGTIPEEIGALSGLWYLSLFGNDLEGGIPRSLSNCTGLRILQLNSNPLLAGPIPIELGRLHHLQYLILWGSNHIGSIPSSLGNCTSLVYLLLSTNRLSGTIPAELAKLQRLKIMELSYNQLSGGLEMLKASNLTSLIEFHLASNQISGSVPGREFAQLRHLEVIELANNRFSKEIPWDDLSDCSSLGSLGLSSNHLSGGIPSTLGKFRNLQYLYLSDNTLRGSLPAHSQAYQSPTLLEVNLSFNKLNGSLPSSLVQALTSLQIRLDLSHNLFSGPLPSWLGKLVMVQIIDLSHNHISGELPASLGACIALTQLRLSQNHLSGEVPLQLGNLKFLQTLDLSFNNLTGVLPSFLESLHYLHFLDVSFNNFTGAVPLHGIFQHLNATSLQGNPSLCGPIIHKTCMEVQPSKEHHHGIHFTHKSIIIAALTLVAVGLALTTLTAIYYRVIVAPRKVRGLQQFELVKRYSAQELHEATRGYSESHLIGEGGLALVYKAELPDGKVVAVKKLKDLSLREMLLKEVQTLGKLRHTNLMRILGCVLNLEVHALVLEYMPNGTLEQFMNHIGEGNAFQYRFSLAVLLNMVLGVAKALTYLHHGYGTSIIHGDVKPSNILLDSEFEAHLSDFGLAKLVEGAGATPLSSNFKGSIGYMAPEYAWSAQITAKVDVYSFGVVVLETLTGKKPTSAQFSGSTSLCEWVKAKLVNDNVGVLHEHILHASLCQDIKSSSNATTNAHIAKKLLMMGLYCTQDNSNERPTMQEVCAVLFDLKREHSGYGESRADLTLEELI